MNEKDTSACMYVHVRLKWLEKSLFEWIWSPILMNDYDQGLIVKMCALIK